MSRIIDADSPMVEASDFVFKRRKRTVWDLFCTPRTPTGSISSHSEAQISSPIIAGGLSSSPQNLAASSVTSEAPGTCTFIDSTYDDEAELSTRPRKRLRKYGRLNRRHLKGASLGDLDESDYENDKRSVLLKAAKRKDKSYSKCLLYAALVSSCDSLDILIDPQGERSYSRPASQFERRTPAPQRSRRRLWTLVNPRKTTPFRDAFFAAGRRTAPTSATKRGPMTKWRTLQDQRTDFPRSRPEAKAACTPLKFVPAHIAENAYSVHRLKIRGGIQEPTGCQMNLQSILLSSRATVTAPVLSMTYGSSAFSDIPDAMSTPDFVVQDVENAESQVGTGQGVIDVARGVNEDPDGPMAAKSYVGNFLTEINSSRELRPFSSFVGGFLRRLRSTIVTDASNHPKLLNETH